MPTFLVSIAVFVIVTVILFVAQLKPMRRRKSKELDILANVQEIKRQSGIRRARATPPEQVAHVPVAVRQNTPPAGTAR